LDGYLVFAIGGEDFEWGERGGGVPKTAVGILIKAKRLDAATWHRLIPGH